MSTKTTRLTTILLAFAVLFSLTSVAQASGFASPRAEASVSLFDMAGEWLTSFWSGMTQIFEKDGALGNGGSTSSTTACTNPNGCGDAGWGIDPNG
ncbi:MAG TPA: hypothetical protein VJ725_08015 [Thermoanaerobaculia bacterium]|nr:hypothetical protein [Thermoanaerobaculia bacterium]